jgi:hypothetical protein
LVGTRFLLRARLVRELLPLLPLQRDQRVQHQLLRDGVARNLPHELVELLVGLLLITLLVKPLVVGVRLL